MLLCTKIFARSFLVITAIFCRALLLSLCPIFFKVFCCHFVQFFAGSFLVITSNCFSRSFDVISSNFLEGSFLHYLSLTAIFFVRVFARMREVSREAGQVEKLFLHFEFDVDLILIAGDCLDIDCLDLIVIGRLFLHFLFVFI